MSRQGTAWSVKGVDQATRDIARRASQAAGVTIGEWIDQAIRADADARVDSGAPAAPAGRSTPAPGRVSLSTVDALATRLDQAEARFDGAMRPIARALHDVAERLVELERRAEQRRAERIAAPPRAAIALGRPAVPPPPSYAAPTPVPPAVPAPAPLQPVQPQPVRPQAVPLPAPTTPVAAGRDFAAAFGAGAEDDYAAEDEDAGFEVADDESAVDLPDDVLLEEDGFPAAPPADAMYHRQPSAPEAVAAESPLKASAATAADDAPTDDAPTGDAPTDEAPLPALRRELPDAPPADWEPVLWIRHAELNHEADAIRTERLERAQSEPDVGAPDLGAAAEASGGVEEDDLGLAARGLDTGGPEDEGLEDGRLTGRIEALPEDFADLPAAEAGPAAAMPPEPEVEEPAAIEPAPRPEPQPPTIDVEPDGPLAASVPHWMRGPPPAPEVETADAGAAEPRAAEAAAPEPDVEVAEPQEMPAPAVARPPIAPTADFPVTGLPAADPTAAEPAAGTGVADAVPLAAGTARDVVGTLDRLSAAEAAPAVRARRLPLAAAAVLGLLAAGGAWWQFSGSAPGLDVVRERLAEAGAGVQDAYRSARLEVDRLIASLSPERPVAEAPIPEAPIPGAPIPASPAGRGPATRPTAVETPAAEAPAVEPPAVQPPAEVAAAPPPAPAAAVTTPAPSRAAPGPAAPIAAAPTPAAPTPAAPTPAAPAAPAPAVPVPAQVAALPAAPVPTPAPPVAAPSTAAPSTAAPSTAAGLPAAPAPGTATEAPAAPPVEAPAVARVIDPRTPARPPVPPPLAPASSSRSFAQATPPPAPSLAPRPLPPGTAAGVPGSSLGPGQTASLAPGTEPSPVDLAAEARAGDPRAQYTLATRLAAADPPEFAQAANWFREAAIQGVPNAQYNLGVLYERGLGVPQDDTRALLWYHSAAEQDHPLAQFNLGVMYSAGRGIPLSYAEAARWFARAANRGVPAAVFNLAILTEGGLGVARNPAEAERLLRRAAELGHPAARDRLAAGGLASGSSPLADTASVAEGGAAMDDLLAIQRGLARLGLYDGPVDGIAGPKTREAIVRYQSREGLPVTGLPSAGLRKRLGPPEGKG